MKEEEKRQPKGTDILDRVREEVESCYRLKMPEDFYDFWKFCGELDCDKPCGKFQNVASTRLNSNFKI